METKPRAKTCTLDTKNNQIVLIALERPLTTSTNGAPAMAAALRREERTNPERADLAKAGAGDAAATTARPCWIFSWWAGKGIPKGPLGLDEAL